uniref:Uncharacterized protein n=1 Tax=Mola mola TaxID=94237 RepID=A0A3Q3WHK7_MOLML
MLVNCGEFQLKTLSRVAALMLTYIFFRYEESWFPLHKRSKDCAQAAEVGSVFI